MKNFRALTCYPRASGVTYTLAEATKKFKDGYLVCHCTEESRRVARDNGCKTLSVTDPEMARGLGGVKLWEPMAIEYVMSHYENWIRKLEEKLLERDIEILKLKEQTSGR